VAMTIHPTQMETENSKSSKDKPSNSLKLINLQNKEEYDAENLQIFEFSEDSKWFAYKTKSEAKPKLEKYKDKSLGNILKLRHLNSGTEIAIE